MIPVLGGVGLINCFYGQTGECSQDGDFSPQQCSIQPRLTPFTLTFSSCYSQYVGPLLTQPFFVATLMPQINIYWVLDYYESGMMTIRGREYLPTHFTYKKTKAMKCKFVAKGI